ncbi:MAG: FecR domain-containing protein [Chitinophagaceae bacterium]
MDKMRLLLLLSKKADNVLSDEERNELDTWYESLYLESPKIDQYEDELKQEMLFQFREKIVKPSPQHRYILLSRKMLRVAAVAAGLLLVGSVYFIAVQKTTSAKPVSTSDIAVNIKDVEPGSSRAILMLGDGSKIDLDKRDPGLLARQGSVQVVKLADGTLGYRPQGNEKEEENMLFNTITTPRGGEYKLTLPDGSKVWLNASSSLRFPTVFTGTERRVEVSGEAYFEVAKNRAMPFIVSVNGKQEVTVLGTHFNINAYNEEGTEKITLLEGSVMVAEKNYSITLKPGQQSALTENGFKSQEADVEQVIAWKDGFFEFENASLETVMRGIGRWYDVDIRYQDKPETSVIFGGRISKHLPLSNVLKMLETYGVNAKINGREIMISN